MEALDGGAQIAAGLVVGGVDAAVDALDLEGGKTLAIGALSRQVPFRLVDGGIPAAARALREASAA